MLNLAVAWFLSYCDRVNMAVAAIPMQAEFGWNETTKGLVMAGVFLGYISSQLPGGWLTQRIGPTRVIGTAVFGFSAMTLATPLAAAHSLEALLLARVALGVFEGLAIPATYALVGRWSAEGERTRLLAIVLTGATLGAPGGLLISGIVVETLGWPRMFHLFGTVGLCWTFLWFLFAHDDPEEHPRITYKELTLLAKSAIAPRADEGVPLLRILAHPAVWAAAASKFALNWIVYVFLAWLPSYYSAVLGISVAGSGMLSALPWVAMTLMLHVASWRADRLIGEGYDVTTVRKLMQSIGIGGAMIFLFLMPAVNSVGLALLFTCGATAFLAFCFSGADPAIIEMAPRYRGLVAGFANTIGNLPGIIAIPAIGWLVDTTGSYAGGFFSAALIAISSLVVWLRYGTARRIFD
jgi:ACS family sodium-dependent inorganic phosphate cotransporter